MMHHALTIIAVADLEVAAAFYARALGWEERVRVPVYVEFCAPNGQRFGVYERHGFAQNTGQLPTPIPSGASSGTELYFHVADPASAFARLKGAGARPLSDVQPRPWGDEAGYCADPDGNVIVVARPIPSRDIEVRERGDADRCRMILTALPDWFGIPASVDAYCERAVQQPMLTAFERDQAVGFASVTRHYEAALEIDVMGVLPAWHRRGVGTRLLRAVEDLALTEGRHVLSVKTLSARHPSVPYASTRAFYLAAGFVPIEELPTLWGPANPCVLLTKSLR